MRNYSQPGKKLHKKGPISSGKRVGGTIGLPKTGGSLRARTTRSARGLHPSGYRDNVIHNMAELSKLDPKSDAARIGHTVGNKKRIEIISKAAELGIKVLNPGKLIPKMQEEKEKKTE